LVERLFAHRDSDLVHTLPTAHNPDGLELIEQVADRLQPRLAGRVEDDFIDQTALLGVLDRLKARFNSSTSPIGCSRDW
jgi:hypothetical protein